MKKTLLTVSILFISILAMSQNITKEKAYEFADKLYEVQILSKKGKSTLKKQITELNGDTSIPEMLGFLANTFTDALMYRAGNPSFKGLIEMPRNLKDLTTLRATGLPGSETDTIDLIHHNRDVVGKTLMKTAEDLLSIGLIDNTVFKEIQAKIRNYGVTAEMMVAEYAYERVTYYQTFQKRKDKEIIFIKKLNKAGIISDENLQKLIAPKKEKVLISSFEIFRYSNNAKIFTVKKFSNDPVIGYREVFEEIKTLIPGFDCKNLRITQREQEDKWDKNTIEQLVRISFEVAGTEYSNEFHYSSKEKKPPINRSTRRNLQPSIVNDSFHKGINKYLTDIQSAYRLHVADNPKNLRGEFGVVLLTETQYNAWKRDKYSYVSFLSGENYSNKFTTKTIEKAVLDYEHIGLFNHLTKKELEKGKYSVTNKKINSYLDIIKCFPKTIKYTATEFDEANPYQELVKSYAKFSRGAFTPKNIVDESSKDYESKTVKFAFEFNGKVYTRNLIREADYIDFDAIVLIEKALKENNVNGKFYSLESEDGCFSDIFLTKEQYEFLKEHQQELFEY